MQHFAPQSYEPDIDLLRKVLLRPQKNDATQILDAVADRLFERLGLLKNSPSTVIDLGAGDGRHLAILSKKFPGASVIGADLSHSRIKTASAGRRFWQKRPLLMCLDASRDLPFADASFDLVVSNMLLPWLFNPNRLMAEINRVLADDGAFFISTAGPDTLIELRHAWAEVDDYLHINAFLDMHDIGDLLVSSGVADPVMDTERITVTYPSLDALLAELTGLGFLNVLSGRRKSLTARSVVQRLAQHYPVNAQGGVDATLELVVAHGWKGQPKNSAAGHEFTISVEQFKNQL